MFFNRLIQDKANDLDYHRILRFQDYLNSEFDSREKRDDENLFFSLKSDLNNT
jgi:hypothetical protein